MEYGKIENVVEAKFRIVTPMFLGGANHEADEIRPSSVKGMLRFWWRALNWSKFRSVKGADDASALRELHKEEAKLFGSAANDGKGGQGQFLLTVQSDKLQCTNKGQRHKFSAAARYLGYGLMNAGQLKRDCINEDQLFTVKLLFRGEVNSTIKEAMKAMGLLGGLGSRTRHGMGSLCLESLRQGEKTIWSAPTSKDKYIEAVQKLLAETLAAIGQPPYTAFSDKSRVNVLLEETSPYSVLNEFGRGEMMYRSWGQTQNGIPTVLHQPSEKRFELDHHWSKGARYPGYPTDPDFRPQRVIFGLPHNYGPPLSQQVKPAIYNRRASPLLFHVHRLGENAFIGTSVLLPATFLPEGEKITAGSKDVPAKIGLAEWEILDKFLDGKVGNPPTAMDRFPSRKAVLP